VPLTFLQVCIGKWECEAADCKRTVEYDGNADGVFSMRRKNSARHWLLFTRGVLDKLVSFIIAGRITHTAATRHISAGVEAFPLRRSDVVKLGTAIMKTFEIPPQSGQCPLCGPNPAFIVIDAQALGCSDPDDTSPLRPGKNCRNPGVKALHH